MRQTKPNIALLLIATCVSILGCSKDPDAHAKSRTPSSSSPAQVVGDPALALVDRYDLGSNLERMANDVAKATHTYGLVAQVHGANNASAVVAREIEKLVPIYQEQWNKNLANAYSTHFSQAELRSLIAMGKNSPFAGKLVAERHVVSQNMQQHSEALLKELVTEALTNATKPR